MGIDELLKTKREEILRIAAKHGAYNVRVFGSMARGEAGPTSDVDFLVEMEEGRSLLDVGGLIADLEGLLGLRIDVSTDCSLHWFIRDRVVSEAVALQDFDVSEYQDPRWRDGSSRTVKDDRLYLIRILELCERIETITQEGRDDFLRSELKLDASLYNLGMIGRMAQRVSSTLSRTRLEVPWDRLFSREAMLGLDDRFSPDEVWNILERDLPDLRRNVKAILQDLGEKPK